MKKIILISFIFLSLNSQAQFIEAKPPTKEELRINNINKKEELKINKVTSIPTLLKMAKIAKKNKEYVNLVNIFKKAVKLKPNEVVLKYKLAEAYALSDKKSEAFNTLINIQKQGFYFDLENNENLANINTFPVFKYIKENMDANNQHFGDGIETFNINKSFSGLLFESLVFDASRPAFLMGSLRDGSVIKITNDGEITTLVPASKGGMSGPWATIDLAVDDKNNVLWVASAAVTQFGKSTKATTGMAGVFKYELSTGKLLKSYVLPEKKRPFFISSMTLTAKGDLYFIGNLNKSVFKIAKDSDQVELAFSSSKYNDMRHIASDETGTILYINDNEVGIIILNLLNNDVYTFANTEALNLTGITDLIYDDNGLIFIQSGTKPERVMRLALKKSKFVIDHIFPIDVANPAFDSPTVGTIIGEGVYYIANTQSAKTNIYGGLRKGNEWDDMVILSSNKHYKEQETLDYQNNIAAQKKNTGSQ
jgi:hypothetical protein